MDARVKQFFPMDLKEMFCYYKREKIQTEVCKTCKNCIGGQIFEDDYCIMVECGEPINKEQDYGQNESGDI